MPRTKTLYDRLTKAELAVGIVLQDFTETVRELDEHAATLLAVAQEADQAATAHQLLSSSARVLASQTQKRASRIAELLA